MWQIMMMMMMKAFSTAIQHRISPSSPSHLQQRLFAFSMQFSQSQKVSSKVDGRCQLEDVRFEMGDGDGDEAMPSGIDYNKHQMDGSLWSTTGNKGSETSCSCGLPPEQGRDSLLTLEWAPSKIPHRISQCMTFESKGEAETPTAQEIFQNMFELGRLRFVFGM